MDDARPTLGQPSAKALAVQAEHRKLQEWWNGRQREWVLQMQEVDKLHAGLAAEAGERQAAERSQRPTSELLPRLGGESGGDESVSRLSEKQDETQYEQQDGKQPEKQPEEEPEKQLSKNSQASDSASPGIADALDGWNARKSPRSKSSGSTAARNVLSNGKRRLGQEAPRQQHVGAAEPTVASVKATGFSSRDPSGIKAQKKPRERVSSSVSPQSPLTSNKQRRPPTWYNEMKSSTTRTAGTSSADVLLGGIKAQIITLKKMGPMINNQNEMNELRDILHKAPFLAMGQRGPQLVRDKRLLSNEHGLPQIFDDNFATSMKGHWPWDVQSDAEELYHKWSAKIFDHDMLFELILAQKGKYADDDRTADRVDKKYQVCPKYKGNGKLVNGQWWPTLLCALRDGAHGDSQAGISGDAGEGAYSCFMSGGRNHPYPDVDHGDIVEYFGQDATTPDKISRGTSLLMKSKQNNIPVRFIRSHRASTEPTYSKYAPKKGFRYDGLYDVTSYELVNESNQRYKFKLVRQTDQGPIRGGNGPEARPTKQEVERFKQDKRFRGF